MGILKKIKEKITGKKEEAPKIEIKEEEEEEWDEEERAGEEEEEEEERKISVIEVISEPVPMVIEERKDTELSLIVLKEEEEVIVEKEEVPAAAPPVEEKEEEGEIVPEEGVPAPPLTPEVPGEVEVKEEVEEGLEEAGVGITVPEEVIDQSEVIEVEERLKKVEKERKEVLGIKEEEEVMVVEEERSIAEEFAGLPLGERFMKWFEKVFLGDEEVFEATRGLEDTVCSFICQDTQFYIEKKGVGNPARIVEGRSLKPDAHVRVSATTAENVIRIKELEVAETVLFENPNSINIKFNVDVLDLTKKGYLRVPILRKIVR